MDTQAKICEYCGHLYINPCSDTKRAQECPNTKLKDRPRSQDSGQQKKDQADE